MSAYVGNRSRLLGNWIRVLVSVPVCPCVEVIVNVSACCELSVPRFTVFDVVCLVLREGWSNVVVV